MAIPRWTPGKSYTRQEKFLLKRLRRHRKLFAFLRDHRLDLFFTEDILVGTAPDISFGLRLAREF